MSSSVPPPPSSRPSATLLPVEPQSTAEILSSTHLFTFEVLSAKASSWNRGKDGLEHRQVALELRLLKAFKGAFATNVGQTFPATVEQRREDAFQVNDYHGLWSHVSPEPAPGVSYLALTTATSMTGPADPGALLKEPPCTALLAVEAATDITLAEEAEQHLRAAVKTGATEAETSIELLRFADRHASKAGGLFARYLWARIAPSMAGGPSALRTGMLSLLSKSETSGALRLGLLSDLDEVLPDITDTDAAFVIQAARALTAVLTEPRAAELHSRVANTSLYHLVFGDEQKAAFAAQQVVPDAAARLKVADVLRSIGTPQAHRLSAWASR